MILKGTFYYDRRQTRKAALLTGRLFDNLIQDDERLSEVSVPSTVRGLAKSHQVVRVSDNRANVEASMFRVSHLERVGNRPQEARDKRKAFKEARQERARMRF